MTCDAAVKSTCGEEQHKTYDLTEDATGIQGKLDTALDEFYKGDNIRGKVDKELQAKMKAIQAQIVENNSCRHKIRHLIENCLEISKLSAAIKVSPEMRMQIQEASEEAQREVEQAELLLNHVLIPSSKVNYLKPNITTFC